MLLQEELMWIFCSLSKHTNYGEPVGYESWFGTDLFGYTGKVVNLEHILGVAQFLKTLGIENLQIFPFTTSQEIRKLGDLNFCYKENE